MQHRTQGMGHDMPSGTHLGMPLVKACVRHVLHKITPTGSCPSLGTNKAQAINQERDSPTKLFQPDPRPISSPSIIEALSETSTMSTMASTTRPAITTTSALMPSTTLTSIKIATRVLGSTQLIRTNLEASVVKNIIEAVGVHEELGQTVYRISCEILCKCSGNGDLHARTMAMLNLLGNFTWDAKVVLVLAAFATSYGEFWLISQLNTTNPLAVLVALLKQLPKEMKALGPRFKALSLLVKNMVDVVKCTIDFEELQIQLLKVDDKASITANSQIYVAAYWVIRSVLACSSLITDVIAMNSEQMHVFSLNLPLSILNLICFGSFTIDVNLESRTSGYHTWNLTSNTIATWELSSLFGKVNDVCDHLQKQMDICNFHIETKVHDKLFKLCNETNINNSEVLCTLFSLKDDMPLKDCSSQAKLSVSELVNKVVVLLISKPDILPLEGLLFLVQQTCNRLYQDEENYEVVWVPLASSAAWTDSEIEVYDDLSTKLPWFSVRQPWSLNSSVVSYIKQAWHFLKEPLMVTLDPYGKISSFNAIDMVLLWGAKAFPFSTLREGQLWEDVMSWSSLRLTMEGINPLISMLVEEGRTICIYGSNNLEWIREFTSKIKEMMNTGVQLELVYVGKKKHGESVDKILATIPREELSSYLSCPKIDFFWLRLESIRRSKVRLGKTVSTDHVLKEVVSLMSLDDKETSWALMGNCSSLDRVILLHGNKIIECLKLFPVWGENIGRFGFLNAIRSAFEPLEAVVKCFKCKVIPYTEESNDRIVVCEECKRSKERLILYQCCVTE
ncbi:hypothetical protein GIB67_027752 [Kingdonia uniflora]|uniref:Uncharacterized protein n=1 Tax=Kingdonia uniflora TaxID=39325 RepID=A0A7J7PCD6_9MAGN|nr:hypothetical protein GIB67_027752 [Kingdonia uniflora]